MRFVSQYGNYWTQLRPELTEAYSNGAIRQIQAPIYARFVQGDLLQHEHEAALLSFSFPGRYQERDEATPVDPQHRISTFDSVRTAEQHGWDDELREWVEQRLLASPHHGIDFIHV